MPPRLVYATATLWMKMAATAVALLALAATSSSARGVSALRSSVDRDFLRAHFEAHLLQRDWIPQPSSFSSLSQHAAEVAQQHAASGGGVADASAVSATAANAAAASAASPSSPSSLPIAHAPTNHDDDTPPKKNKVLFVTAIFGDYEKTLKEPARQEHPADFVAFTDRTDLASPTWQIRLVEDPLDYLLKHGGSIGVGAGGSVLAAAANANAGETAAASVAEQAGKGHGTAAEQAGKGPGTAAEQAGKGHGTAAAGIETTSTTDGVNSLTRNRHPFNLAKVFKMQFYRFFDLTEYRSAVWLDGTIQIIGPQTAGLVFHLLAEQGRNLVTFEHNRRGLLSAEAVASKTEKYEGTHWGCCDQPYQNVTRQYEQYLQEGFSEKWWLEEYDAPMGISKRPEWGLWVTSFVAFDLHSPTSFEFLDAWWRENVVHSTQDQVSFPFVAWKMKVYPFSLPSPGVSAGSWMRNDFFARAEHGTR